MLLFVYFLLLGSNLNLFLLRELWTCEFWTVLPDFGQFNFGIKSFACGFGYIQQILTKFSQK